MALFLGFSGFAAAALRGVADSSWGDNSATFKLKAPLIVG
jgi:hypothetical protein